MLLELSLLPVAPGRPDEAQLQRVLNALDLRIAAQASEAYAVIHLLRAVLVSDVEDDALLAAVEQEPSGIGIRARSGAVAMPRWYSLSCDIADEELGAATSPPSGRGVHLGDSGHAMRVSCHRTDGADGSGNVVHPDLALGD